ncbi:MAG: hypothetical protein JO041_00935 [Acidobacteria bacterium]|nr:hypothetical protein [Acidobacteriota bacterium]
MTTRKSSAGQRVSAAANQMESELKEFVRWFNDDVVPNVRIGSSKALRTASTKLAELAEELERHTRTPKR